MAWFVPVGVRGDDGLMGGVQKPVRRPKTSSNWFMQPGVFYCGGGVGAGTFEPLPILVEWVENGKVPDQINGARIVDGKTLRTRPLCSVSPGGTLQGLRQHRRSFELPLRGTF
jgi:hypothetical protein